MIKELYLNKQGRKTLIKCDDLEFDGKNIIVPSYWANSLWDFMKENENLIAEQDREDYKQFKNFLFDITEHFNSRGN